ncbi:MAG: dTDP-4-dehydrorhamnose 3,5-epimerase [Bacteroidales bacterium]|jgi:dTDP-4-dehydrorhamnose 3,5-epimerase|nr:dTDP-4-dehydrorhamnose 3,5-epimerase [Bacteroidales bacterium]
MMEVLRFECDGLILIKPKVYADDRGHFLETYHWQKYRELGINSDFVQDNESLSHRLVLRGLHFQSPPFAQGKLIRVLCGSIYDVAVDVRRDSPTFGKWQSVVLSAENKHQFWIPEGFAHGFLALEDNTVINYKCTANYHASAERTLLWNDTDLNIGWPETPLIVSSKDKAGEIFRDFVSPF